MAKRGKRTSWHDSNGLKSVRRLGRARLRREKSIEMDLKMAGDVSVI
jgi:hypothetical protein